MTISLRAVTVDNWEDCIALRVRADQEVYVDSNLYCIAEAYIEPRWTPLAIYAEETMVGLVVSGGVESGVYVIHHLMIDRQHQRQGYGAAALREVVRRLRALLDCRAIALSYWSGNPAARLYEALGFAHTGERWGEEPVMQLATAPGEEGWPD